MENPREHTHAHTRPSVIHHQLSDPPRLYSCTWPEPVDFRLAERGVKTKWTEGERRQRGMCLYKLVQCLKFSKGLDNSLDWKSAHKLFPQLSDILKDVIFITTLVLFWLTFYLLQ